MEVRNLSFVLLSSALALLTPVWCFPDGAPVDACVKPRPNQPYHGQARTQSLNTLPYSVVASGSKFAPGTKITVQISGSVPFKGFFLQARDVQTGAWIGSWDEAEHTMRHPECAAVTHADPRPKQRATLVWTAPANLPPSRVYFTGTVLKDYGTFWAELIAEAPQEENEIPFQQLH